MHEYKLSPLFFSQMRKRMLTIALPFSLLAVAAGLWLGGRGERLTTLTLLLVLILVPFLIYRFVLEMRRQQKHWSSYRLIVDETSIKRVQDDLAEITIGYGEISKITESPRGGLTIEAQKPSRQIVVFATLEDYSQFRRELAARHPIETMSETRSSLLQFAPALFSLAALILLVLTYASPNPYLRVSSGILLSGVLVASFVSIQRSAHSTKRLKRMSYFFVLPLLSIALRVWADILTILKP